MSFFGSFFHHNFRKSKIGGNRKSWQKRLYHSFFWLIMAALMAGSIYMVRLETSLFKASLISIDLAPAFDGTVAPLKKVPNWVKLTTEEREFNFSKIPEDKIIDLPVYNPSQLLTAMADLEWGSTADDAIRNSKITFSVPYLGNYKLDGIEGAGSHPAVDIKAPVGTPVYAMANGVVTKSQPIDNGGFGKHIVIGHTKAPTLNDATAQSNIYSSYSHLSTVLVSEGQIIRKGDLIGEVGQTGTATTPHLHFQIDTDGPAWHPYWPFTSTEASAAGLSFFQALNSGLGKANAEKNTINAMKYVQKYLTYSVTAEPELIPPVEPVIDTPKEPGLVSENKTTESVEIEINPITEEKTTIDEPITTPPTTTNNPSIVTEVKLGDDLSDLNDSVKIYNFSKFTFSTNSQYIVGDTVFISIAAINQALETVSNPNFSETLNLSLTNDIGVIQDTTLDATAFSSGRATVIVSLKQAGSFGLQFTLNGVTYRSTEMTVTDGKNIENAQSVNLPAGQVFTDVFKSHPQFVAISYLKEQELIGGYPDGSFRPDQVVSRVEALKFIFAALELPTKRNSSLPFPDTSSLAWYSPYIGSAVDLKIVKGYPDGTFRPTNMVLKVEFLKMLIEALELDVDPLVPSNPYSDVSRFEWYAPQVQLAKDKGFIDEDLESFYPAKGMTRAEVAEMIYRVITKG